jgi:hypothetical protein
MVLLRLVFYYYYYYCYIVLLCLACCCLRNDVSSSAQIFDAFIFAVRAIVPLNVFLVLMISKLPDASIYSQPMLYWAAARASPHLLCY